MYGHTDLHTHAHTHTIKASVAIWADTNKYMFSGLLYSDIILSTQTHVDKYTHKHEICRISLKTNDADTSTLRGVFYSNILAHCALL